MQLIKSLIEAPGTTSHEIVTSLYLLAQHRLGLWPMLWRVLLAETTTEEPYSLDPAWAFQSLAAPLDAWYEERHGLNVEKSIEDIPQQYWAHTKLGGGQIPATTAIASAVHRVAIEGHRSDLWRQLTSNDRDDVMDTLEAVRARRPQAQIAQEEPIVIILVAAGGSTGHAVGLSGLDYWLAHPDRPQCVFFVIGPDCGASLGGQADANANAANLFLSLQRRFTQHPGRLWTCWLDSSTDRRDALKRETAEFLFDFLATPWGGDLRRRLVDGFRKAGRKPNDPAPNFVCRIDIRRREVQARNLQERCALGILANAMKNAD